MTVKFKNSAKGVATKAKVVTDTKTGNIISQAQDTELVPIPMQEGMAMLGSVMQLAEVSYAAGFTKGMPNYSSLRVDIGIKVPCPVEDVDETYAFADEWVSKRLKAEHDEVA